MYVSLPAGTETYIYDFNTPRRAKSDWRVRITFCFWLSNKGGNSIDADGALFFHNFQAKFLLDICAQFF